MERIIGPISLSIVMTGRDDDYGDSDTDGTRNLSFTPIPYVMRLTKSLQMISDGFTAVGISSEIVLVDWAPQGEKFLYKNPSVRKLAEEINLRIIIVSSQRVKAMGLNPKGFDEFFAKNVGIRNSAGEFLLLTNSDAWPNEELLTQSADFVNSRNFNNYARPTSRIDLGPDGNPTGEGPTFNGLDLGGYIGTPAAGDYVLTRLQNVLNVQGYNESTSRRRSKTRQAGIDGQLLMSPYLRGIHPFKLRGSVLTYDHNKIKRRDYGVAEESYQNESNWGLADVKAEFCEVNVTIYDHINRRQHLGKVVRKIFRKYRTAQSLINSGQMKTLLSILFKRVRDYE
jgi:hypothetical protein